MGVFIGLDVSRRKTAVCVVDRDGTVLLARQGAKRARSPDCASGGIVRRDRSCGIEACPLSEWLHRGLREAGIPVVCVEVRTLSASCLRARSKPTETTPVASSK
jgi:transposase